MTENFRISSTGLLINNNRVFLPSKNINIFPCSRRGQAGIEDSAVMGTASYYDPEARLNTERTNRIGTAINGFTDSFIVNDTFVADRPITFVLAGYRVEIKGFNPADIAAEFATSGDVTLYAYLGLHGGISLNVTDYFTEILYRQSMAANDNNYLDVSYSYTDANNQILTGDFFVGVSFTISKDTKDDNITPYLLPLFSNISGTWKLIESSKLPKIEHDSTLNSIKLSGDFTVEHTDDNDNKQTSFKVTKDATLLGPTVMSSLIVGEKAENDTFTEGVIKAKEIKVEDNINVGNPSTKAEANNGGCIVAEYDITAEEDLVAKRNIHAGVDLTVGTDSNENTGTIIAKKLVSTPKVSVDIITSKSPATDAKINVDKPLVADSLEVINKTTLKGTVQVDNSLTVTGNTTLNNGLKVANGDTDLRKLAATELKVAADALMVTKDDAKFTKPVTVDSSLTANNVQIKDQGQVPALELYHFKNGPYQLRFKFNTAPTIIEEE